MIGSVNPSENAPAQKSVAGGASVRRDEDRRRHGGDDLATGRRGREQSGRPRDHGVGGGPARDREGPSHAPEPEPKPPPEEPGLVMVRQLAGDAKSEKALSRLLDDLDELNAPARASRAGRPAAEPVAPFLSASSIDGPFHRAASAYEWGHRTLNRADPVRPGALYSERF